MDRPLDGLERQYWLAGREVRVNCVIAARLRGNLAEEHLRAALDLAQRRHPLLGVRIEEAAGGPRFVSQGTGRIPLRVVEGESWVTEADRDLAEPFDARNGPLARATLVRRLGGADLLVAWDHIVGDGLGSFALVRDLLAWSADLAAGRKPAAEPLPEQPPMAGLNPVKAAQPGLGRALLGDTLRVLGRVATTRPRKLPKDAEAPPAARRTRLLPRVLDASATKALVGRSKAEGTTVHGAIAAALLRAARDELGADGVQGLGLASPVNLRPYLHGLHPEAFGYYSFGVGTFHRVQPKAPFWDLARACGDAVARQVERRSFLRALAWVEGHTPTDPAAAPRIVERLDRFYPAAVSASNLGRVEAPDRYGAVTWEEAHFGAGMNTGGAIVGLAACTFRGQMALDVFHPEPLVSRARAARIADAMAEDLAKAGGG